MNFKKHFAGKKIIVTGHSGFKGSWLTLWLNSLGAKVIGISLDAPTKPSHLEALNLKKKITEKKIDIRKIDEIKKIFKKNKPDYVFHLAAQSLVKRSYKEPILTWDTNALGTRNILECLRILKKKCVAIFITSDKSYRNLELKRGYRENDVLGGFDPYSSSKASAELVINSYVHSYFTKNKNNVLIGIARAGNVIGGGDWSSDRLIPDCVKSWSRKKTANIRNPNSTRPWQHVMEALSGYLMFAIKLKKNHKLHGQAFNFGPNNSSNFKVINLVNLMNIYWKNVSWKIVKKEKFYESGLLKLNSSKAKKLLGWKSILNFRECTKLVAVWYKEYYNNRKNAYELSLSQIQNYQKLLKKRL